MCGTTDCKYAVVCCAICDVICNHGYVQDVCLGCGIADSTSMKHGMQGSVVVSSLGFP